MSITFRDFIRRARWLVVVVACAFCVARPNRAHATSCIEHAYERMDLERTGVFIGTRAVAAPAELGAVDELLNSGLDGKGLLLWEKSTMAFGKFYNLAEAWTPDPSIQPWLTASARKKLPTGCGYSVPYTPILPGRYKFDQEHMGGEHTSKGVDDPEILVAPGRDRIELRFRLRGKRYRAEYSVLCASFQWEAGPAKQCAKSVSSPWPASALSPEPPEPEPAPTPSATGQPTAAPGPSISVVSVPFDPPPSTSTDPRNGRGCGSCSVGAPTEHAPTVWALALACGILVRVRGERRGTMPR